MFIKKSPLFVGDAAGITPAPESEFTNGVPHSCDHVFATTIFESEYTVSDALNDWLLDGSNPYFMGVSDGKPKIPNVCVNSHRGSVAAATQIAATAPRVPPKSPLPYRPGNNKICANVIANHHIFSRL